MLHREPQNLPQSTPGKLKFDGGGERQTGEAESGNIAIDGTVVWSKSGTGLWLSSFGNQCGTFGYADDKWSTGFLEIAHSAKTATVTVTSTLNQPAADESFGVDNVILEVK